MKNYLLPIYHSKFKPWIKWWLLKQLELRSKTLSDWIEGTTPITITGAFKEKIQNLELEGNTSQTGTPTPDNPIPVQVVKGHNVIKINTTEYPLDLKSKNLFDGVFRQGNRFDSGLSDTTRLFTTQNYPVKSGITYTISTTLNTSVYKFAVNLSSIPYPIPNVQPSPQFYDSGWKTLSSFTFTPNQDGYFAITVAQLNGTSALTPLDISSFTWQLEEGEAATTYEPYYDYELCKIGDDYSDYILPDTNGYKILKSVRKVLDNGTANWVRGGFGTNPYYLQVDNMKIPTNTTPNYVLCNLFKGVAYKDRTVSGDNIIYADISWGLYVRNTSYANVTDFKTMLASNPITIYYVLDTPTTETITNTNLIAQLNAIYNAEFKNGTNTITQTPSDLPFILHFKYYKKG